MDLHLFEKLTSRDLISSDSFQKIKAAEDNRLFSLHWQLKTILYLGITLLSTGLGLLIYKNIDTIGHQVILAGIALASGGCFLYCIRKSAAFSLQKVPTPDTFFDYILLLGCLTLLTFIGYWQAQYSVFGNAYGLATFIPMVILFITAYRFDHLGVLSLAIVNLAAWAGVSIAPLHLLKENDFSDASLIYTGVVLGLVLIAFGQLSQAKKLKAHFEFTYSNFGVHLLFISGLAGLFKFEGAYILWFLWLMGMGFLIAWQAIKRRSFYFLLVVTGYDYIALSYVVIRILMEMRNADMAPLYLACLYFIGSAIGIVRMLIILNRKMKAHDSV